MSVVPSHPHWGKGADGWIAERRPGLAGMQKPFGPWTPGWSVPGAGPGHTVSTAAPERRVSVALGRGVRVVTLLAAIWVISGFDYLHTVLAVQAGLADECNPLALWVLQHGDGALLAFKLGIVACASSVMFLHRSLALTEWLALGVFVALVFVALRWNHLYELYAFVDRMAPPGYPL